MKKIILTMICSAVVLPPFANAVTPLPEKVACTIADKQAFQTPDCVHLTGWIGSRIDINEKTRMAKMDPERLLASYRRRPGWQSFDGEDMGKWLHAATLAWVNSGDPELRKKLDYTATELVKTQLEDGYLGTYANENRWTEWDVWAHKLKTWPQARVFHINALAHGAPKEIRLIPFADAGSLGGQYRVWLPLYSHRTGNVLVEGDWSWSRGEFPVGSINDEDAKSFIVSRYNKPATADWFAVSLDEPQTIVRVRYAHGKTAPDGGWFDASAGKPRIQIQTSKGGEWQDAGELKDYPATTATSAATLRDGEMFTCQLAAPVKVIGVRVVGKPAGGNNPNHAYSSCAELQAFGM